MSSLTSLTAAIALTGTEPLPIDQSGATVKATVNQVKTYVNTTPAITGGSINSTPIGATTPSSGAFTSLSVNAAVANGAWAANTAIGNYTASSGAFSSATDYCIAHYTVANSDNTTGGVKFGSVASGSYTADFVVAPRVGGIYIEKLRLSSIGLAVTGNISSSGRTLVGTTTDDGVNALQVNGAGIFAGLIKPQQATTAGAPAYVKGAIYFDTTLNKLRVGGATAWETITSV